MARINKARYWTGVLWLENLDENWQDEIADLVQVPFAYCVHDKDVDEQNEGRKPHVHLILVFPNTTTYNHALQVFKLLGEKAVNTIQACISIRNTYEYLIHNTETCEKKNKHKYSQDERITGNGFDIGFYEQVSASEKQEMLKELCDFIIDNNITNFADFFIAFNDSFANEYFDVVSSHSAMLERITRGNYLKWRKSVEAQAVCDELQKREEKEKEKKDQAKQEQAEEASEIETN